jgi:hypothetical protein
VICVAGGSEGGTTTTGGAVVGGVVTGGTVVAVGTVVDGDVGLSHDWQYPSSRTSGFVESCVAGASGGPGSVPTGVVPGPRTSAGIDVLTCGSSSPTLGQSPLGGMGVPLGHVGTVVVVVLPGGAVVVVVPPGRVVVVVLPGGWVVGVTPGRVVLVVAPGGGGLLSVGPSCLLGGPGVVGWVQRFSTECLAVTLPFASR